MTHSNPLLKHARPVTPMGLIVAQLAELAERAEALSYTEPDFTRTLQQVRTLADRLDPYIAACSTPESAALAGLAAGTQQEDWADRFACGETAVALEQEMLSGHVEGQFLKMLVHAINAQKILEIGLFTGYSALAMAEALPDNGSVLAFEVEAFVARFAGEQFAQSPHGKKIRIEVGPAMESLRRLQPDEGPFDLIFIDADKGGYSAYVDAIIEHSLLAPHGLICVDNTLMQGQPYLDQEKTANGEAIALFNEALMNNPNVEQVLLPLRDGLTLIRRV